MQVPVGGWAAEVLDGEAKGARLVSLFLLGCGLSNKTALQSTYGDRSAPSYVDNSKHVIQGPEGHNRPSGNVGTIDAEPARNIRRAPVISGTRLTGSSWNNRSPLETEMGIPDGPETGAVRQARFISPRPASPSPSQGRSYQPSRQRRLHRIRYRPP